MLAAGNEDKSCKVPSKPIISFADIIAQCREKVGIFFNL